MNRVRRILKPERKYQPIDQDRNDGFDSNRDPEAGPNKQQPFSLVEYWIFLLLGIAMLWAWNMFLAAAPYFQTRFSSHEWILTHFQSAEISVSTSTNFVSMLVLTKLQKGASYPFRIGLSLCIYTATSVLLALSTLVTMSAGVYFGFLMLMVFSSSLATGLIQNGVFAFVGGFGRGEYTQAIMTGQAVAGVLPCLAQIASVLAVPKKDERLTPNAPPATESPKSAFAFFSTAIVVSVLTLLAFIYLLRSREKSASPAPVQSSLQPDSDTSTEAQLLADPEPSSPTSSKPREQKSIGLVYLFFKLPSLSTAVVLCFTVTMVFPVFTSTIHSVHPSSLPPTLFIPLAFLIWNIGDLLGRLSTLLHSISLTHKPIALLILSLTRLIFIPLYLLCNLRGQGAVVESDLFYLAVVQLLFGLTNGYLGSSCMIGAGEWVDEEEKQAAGAFMGLCLVAGLTVGSLLSFFVAEL